MTQQKTIFHNTISNGYFVLAVSISIFISLYVRSYTSILPVVLLLGGFTIKSLADKRIAVDDDLDEKESSNILYYTAAGAVGLFVVNILVSYSSFPASIVPQQGSIIQNMQLTVVGSITGSTLFDELLFTIMMAISEEQFFRGGLLSYFLASSVPFLAMIGSAIVFMVYHFLVYGTSQNSLMFVLMIGAVLAYITYKTQSLVAAKHAHVLNNVMATLGGMFG